MLSKMTFIYHICLLDDNTYFAGQRKVFEWLLLKSNIFTVPSFGLFSIISLLLLNYFSLSSHFLAMYIISSLFHSYYSILNNFFLISLTLNSFLNS